MSQETLGKLIRNARKQRHWSQAKLADKLGVVMLTVIRWEMDKARPRSDMQQRLIELLGLSAEMFIQAKKPPERTGESQAMVEALPQVEIDILPQASMSEEEDYIEYTIPPMMKTYRGWRQKEWDETYQVYTEKVYVTVDGQPLTYFDKHDPVYGNSDPEEVTIYEWGYTSTGPRRLAESILGDYFGETAPQRWEDRAVCQTRKYCYNFKMDFVAWFPKKVWEISSEAITAWLREQKEGGDPAPEHKLSDVYAGWRGWSERRDNYKAR